MQLVIKQAKDLRKLQNFLAAIVVNKALFWSLHIKSNLEQMRSLGIAYWNDSQKVPLSPAWAKKKAKLNGHQNEANVATGQTRAQALFLTGDGDMHMTGRGNVLSNINAVPWVADPSKGARPWKAQYADRRMYILSATKGRNFWRTPRNYIDLSSADKNIWQKTTDAEVSVDEASKMLIMPISQTNAILKRKLVGLGKWKDGSNSGVAAKWS